MVIHNATKDQCFHRKTPIVFSFSPLQWAHITKQFQEEFSPFLCTLYPETQFQEDFV